MVNGPDRWPQERRSRAPLPEGSRSPRKPARLAPARIEALVMDDERYNLLFVCRFLVTTAQNESVLLDPMSGFEFEEFVARLLSKLGFGRIEKVLFTQDEGRDILVRTPTGLVVVECKHQPRTSIGRPVVQKLHSAVVSSGAVKGMLVTTGRFTKEALTYAEKVSPPIEMIDHPLFAEMAARAGIKLVSRARDLNVWTYSVPILDMTFAALGSYLGSTLNSHPASPDALVRDFRRGLLYEPTYVVTYDVDAVFETTVGVVHQERARGAKFALSGDTGKRMDPAVFRFISPEPQVAFLGIPEEFHGELPSFRLDTTTLRTFAKSNIKRLHTRTVTYRGRNNQTYQKVCEPGDRHILITDIRQVYLPLLKLNFKLLKTPYEAEVIQAPSGRILPRVDDVRRCRVCGLTITRRTLLCNTCGRATHSGGFFLSRIHGFRCRRCRKTTCRYDGEWIRRLLFFKALLCPTCAPVAAKEGKRVTPLQPLAARKIPRLEP